MVKSIKDIFRSYAVFDADGKHVNGSDKQSNHAYGDAYEKLFPHRDEVKFMMEVGVADGSSLLAWSEVFPKAHCVGMDIHQSIRLYTSGRMEFHLGNQRSQEDCERVAAGRQFDFICEDATHQLDDSLRTLLYLWPFIKIGGLYVIEDVDEDLVKSLRRNIKELWPFAEIVKVPSPFAGVTDHLIVFRKVWKLHDM